MPAKEFGNGFHNDFGRIYQRGFLQLMVGDHPTYEDGDIVSAVNWRYTRHTTCEGLCFARRASDRRPLRLNGTGFLNTSDISRDFFEETHEFRFERVNANQLKKVRLSDNAEIIFTSGQIKADFDGRDVSFDAASFFGRMLRTWGEPNARGKWLFGTDSQNIQYYGGKMNSNHDILDNVWSAVESKLGVLESSVDHAPFSDYKKRLVIAVNDFSDSVMDGLSSPLLDETDPENPVTVKKRKNWVTWRGLRDVVESDVLDKKKLLRLDQIRKHIHQDIVNIKSV